MTIPKQKDLYFLDFDGTLFNTDAFWNDVRKACSETLDIPEAVFLETYGRAKSPATVYDIDAHLGLLDISREDIRSVFASVFQKTAYAFLDVVPFFDNHSEDAIVILTQGVEWFQQAKIASLPIANRNTRVIVTDYKKRRYIEEHIGFYEDGVLWEGNHYNSLSFVDNMADAFLPEEHGAAFRQYRIRRHGDDANAEKPTRGGSIEIGTLLDI